ncbi:cullin-2-like [Rhopalosiphum maidis]|uniref:cullin-2-like n=1 Tax=Rhopalosiphum maidis TaxID=43146 RepID=UPI000EFF146A|nr:cullin-2-like [Rhopalosiphum maidis]
MSITTPLDTIVGIINSFIEISRRNQPEFYESYFEQPFLEQSRDYFKYEAARLLQEFTVSEYLVKALQFIIKEMHFKKYLHDSTGYKLRKICNQHMVIDHILLIKEEFIEILKEERLDDMKNIYLLLNRNNHGWILITDIFRQHIEQIGIKVIKSFEQKKKACGYEFTSNLYKMITDVRVSEGLNAQFQNEFPKAVSDKLNVSFSTYVLKSDVWPLNLSTTSSFVLPKQLIPYTQYFEVLYKEKYKGRALTWCHHQSREKTYIVKLQTLQMAILLLFEDCDTLKYSEIYDLLQVTNDEFKDHFDSLVKYKLLLLNGDNVKLNMAFTNSHTTFQVKLDVQKDRLLQTKQSVKTVNDDRKIYLQATIIRIMKACKTLRHKPLVDEVRVKVLDYQI